MIATECKQQPTNQKLESVYSGRGHNIVVNTLIVLFLGPDWKGIFGADVNTNTGEQENSDIWYYTSIKSVECCYQIFVTKICHGGRMSNISTNFTPNISALNSKHFEELPLLGKQCNNTILNHSSKHFFQSQTTSLILAHFREHRHICNRPVLADNIGIPTYLLSPDYFHSYCANHPSSQHKLNISGVLFCKTLFKDCL